MRHKLIWILTAVMTLAALAFTHEGMLYADEGASTGLFYDIEREGEGAMVLRDERLVVLYFYTYGARSCHRYLEPSVSPSDPTYRGDCSDDGQRWFFLADKWNNEDNESEGFLYMAEGVNYPHGDPDPTNPFSVIVGKAIPVGVYVLRPSGDGYQMLVIRFGDALDEDDPLYGRVFNFTTPLFEPLGVRP
jgi:hypothetical protein